MMHKMLLYKAICRDRGNYKKWKKILIGLLEAEALKRKERLLAVYIFSHISLLHNFSHFCSGQLLACYPELVSTAWDAEYDFVRG